MRDQIRSFVTRSMINDPAYPLKDDDPLITGGLVDSFSLVELALFLEDTFGAHFEDYELTAANMDTIDQIVANTEAKLA
jgi:acyl carrier protein